MFRDRTLVLFGTAALALCLIVAFNASLSRTAAAQERPAAKPIPEVTLSGRVVDLHCAMTGEHPDKDMAKCTAECIKKGVPAVLETPTGLVLLGHGMQSPGPKLMAFAYQEIEVKGKLYEKHGLKYLDIIAMKPLGEKPETPPVPVEPADEPEEPEDAP